MRWPTASSGGHRRIARQARRASRDTGTRRWLAPALAGSAAALGAAAVYAVAQARRAERNHPPIGRFITVEGVRLHYIERGQGDPVVLLHGNGTLIQDFTVSGLVDRLSARYRVIVFDRPGHGYSTRPRRLWTPRAQAHLLQAALEQLGIRQAVVLGHSWGTMVAVALALEYPAFVRGLVLASGYYYPTARLDTILLSPPAIPVVGDIMRYTISPLLAKLLLPQLVRWMFAPAPVPQRFERDFPKALTLRPVQLRATAEDIAFRTPAAMDLQHHYRELECPVVIVTGGDDQVVDVGRHSRRLHDEVPQSAMIVIPGLGHMVHHLAPDQVAGAVHQAAEQARSRGRSAVATGIGRPLPAG